MSEKNIDKFLKQNYYNDAIEIDSEFLNILSGAYIEYKMLYKTSSKSDIITINSGNGGSYYIVWDVSFWDLFLEFYYTTDEINSSIDSNNNLLLEGNGYILGIFLHYLSKRFHYIPELSNCLERNAKTFGYGKLIENLKGNEHEVERYSFSLLLCKSFVYFHEMSHIEFKKYKHNELSQKYVDIIYSILDGFSEIFMGESEGNGSNYIEIIDKIQNRSLSSNLIEELSADLRAMQRIINLEFVQANKKNLDDFLSSLFVLIDFITIKSLLDKRWDHFVFNKDGLSPTLVEEQIVRRFVFSKLTYEVLGRVELGDSFIRDLEKHRETIENFTKPADVLLNDWYICTILERDLSSIGIVSPMIIEQQVAMLETIAIHMSNIQREFTEKHLKYLFNLALTAQHSSNPLDCIPLYTKYIDSVLQKYNKPTQSIGDAYSRMARVYAESGHIGMADILVNRAIDIVEKQPIDDLFTAALFNNIGNVLVLLENLEKALKYFFLSVKVRMASKDFHSTSLATVFYNISNIYYKQKDYYASLKNLLKAYKLLKNRYDDKNEQFLAIKKSLHNFAYYIDSDISEVIIADDTPLAFMKKAYIYNPCDIDIIKMYSYGIVRELRTASFDDGCEMYSELLEVVDKHIKDDSTLLVFQKFGFVNFRDTLKKEIDQ